jgi:hypothetical protein
VSACYAGERCRGYDRAVQKPADATDTPLCDACLGMGQTAADKLLLDYRDLEQLIPPTLGQWGDGQPGHSGEAPIPINTAVEALQRAIWWVATTWAEALAERYRLADPPTRVRDGHAVQWALGIIRPRLADLARLPEVELADYPLADPDRAVQVGTAVVVTIPGAQGVLDLARLHRRATAALGLNGDTRKLPGHCRDCARPDLRQDNGSDTVYCGHCGNRQTRDDYERYGNVFLRGEAAA